MNKQRLDLIKTEILNTIGVEVDGRANQTGMRQGFDLHFSNYTRQSGPVFLIKPSGLKKHSVSLGFGNYSRSCIKHIRDNANAQAYQLAQAHLETIYAVDGIRADTPASISKEDINSELNLNYIIPIGDQHGDESIYLTARKVIVPLMAAMAELLGYSEEVEEVEGFEDGKIMYRIVKQRERNPRNKLLCLAFHGNCCQICGINPIEIYGDELGNLLEVHHIEPLSEIDFAKVYDPKKDLMPLCPTCHRAIHKKRPAYLPEELKQILTENNPIHASSS